jgi:hypothetical protein
MWLNGYAQTVSTDDFLAVPIPILESKELYALNNRYKEEFAVSIVKGKLQINKAAYTSTIEYALRGGKLLGINQGEFGGGLYYKPNDTTVKQLYINGQPRQANTHGDPFRGGLMIPPSNPITQLIKGTILIKTGDIKGIFTYKDSLYTVEGLAHMSSSFGSISKLDIKGDSVTGSRVLQLDDAPMTFDIYKGDIYIITLRRFYIIHNWQLEKLFDNEFWSYLGPNSVAIKDRKHIYVGMRAGYAMIDAENRKIVFYQHKQTK